MLAEICGLTIITILRSGLMTEDCTYFRELCDVCEDNNLHVGIIVIEFARENNNYMSKVKVVVNRGKTRLVEFKQTKYGWPSIDELSVSAMQELAKRGHIDKEYDDS
jgi:hypothetical protein